MPFSNEKKFEDALIHLLTAQYGWDSNILEYPDEQQLLNNWAEILFQNNRGRDQLNNVPLTQTEMQQIMEKINQLETPARLNGFINGKTISISRDNQADTEHFGKEVYLKIYDRNEIAAGSSRYQIARQPRFTQNNAILPKRRGDLMLLINGMPVIHIELKKSGIPVSNAYNQIEKYSHERIFTGLFSLVQVFVAMTPEETVYFANPGNKEKFNKAFYFHWADAKNNPINRWDIIAKDLLSIPMAHQLIGFYTVADNSGNGDGILKVMRSYQYYAAITIASKTGSHNDWNPAPAYYAESQRGGYVWHTTGSGKTMTSFKAAQLIASSNDADKVVFVIDRIELGTQTAGEYRNFAEESEYVQETENTQELIRRLASKDTRDSLIVTSIQKLSNIQQDGHDFWQPEKINAIMQKRIVFIVDECHRSTFGDMMNNIKTVFKRALFFGFTGTPIQQDNQRNSNTTADIFGDELHRYSIADGIRDKNVLGFDINQRSTFSASQARQAVALQKANAATVEEAFADPKKQNIYNRYYNLNMEGHTEADGTYTKGIEDYLNEAGQYLTPEHRDAVAKDIINNWLSVSNNNKFHAMLATSSIAEAIEYYSLFRRLKPELKITAVFDHHIDEGSDNWQEKEDALVQIITDYNSRYNCNYSISRFAAMKKDIQNRLAHKGVYYNIEYDNSRQLDLLIVVDQMLTGYDSKWVNALYLDKVISYESIIQAFSRTNRIFGPDKPHGIINYYRMPYTMKHKIDAAINLYAANQPAGVFVQKLGENLKAMNNVFSQIKLLFENAGINDFETLPESNEDKGQFAKLFKQFNEYLAAAKVQCFNWKENTYKCEYPYGRETIKTDFTENDYLVLALRYKELAPTRGDREDSVPYDLDSSLAEIDTTRIDAEYMESRFLKYRQALQTNQNLEQAREELHKIFKWLTWEEQKYAQIFLTDIQNGNAVAEDGKTFRDYINMYMERAQNDRIHKTAQNFGVNEKLLREMLALHLNENNINEYGRFDRLKESIVAETAQNYFASNKANVSVPMAKIKATDWLRNFIINGGNMDIDLPNGD